MKIFQLLISSVIVFSISAAIKPSLSAATLYSRVSGDWNNNNTWSFTNGGESCSCVPASTDDVKIIGGHTITIPAGYAANAAAVELNSNMANSSTSLIFGSDETSLSVVGNFTMKPKTSGGSGTTVGTLDLNGGSLSIGGNLTLTAEGAGASHITYTQRIIFHDGIITLDGSLSMSGNVVTSTTTIDMNDGGTFKIGNNVTWGLGATMLNNNGSSGVIEFTGTGNQNIPYQFTYFNLNINNGGTKTLTGPTTVKGHLGLNSGMLKTTNSNLLTLKPGATSSPGNSNSFVDGPMKKTGNSPFVFPVGKEVVGSKIWARLEISAPSASGTEFTVEYFYGEPDNAGDLNGDLNSISMIEYWNISRSSGSSPGDDVFVTFYWEDAARSEITDLSKLVAASFNQGISLWESKGGTVTGGVGAGVAGKVESTTKFSTFGQGTFGVRTSPMPIKLTNFEAGISGNEVIIEWSTASEINNNYFTIEKSTNGLTFQTVAKVKGAGNTNNNRNYSTTDKFPSKGVSYYRLQQTDFDGKNETFDMVAVNYNNISGSKCDFKIHPNPCSGNCRISLTDCEEKKDLPITVTVIDALGNKINTDIPVRNEKGEFSAPFDTNNNLKPGIYIVTGVSNKERYAQKVIKK